MDFNIEEKDIIIPENCPIFGTKLERGIGMISNSSPTLDRIDSSMGYIKGNIHIISWRANNIKKNATLAELKSILDYMKDRLGA